MLYLGPLKCDFKKYSHVTQKSLMIIQLLTHYTKSILKSLINQLCDILRYNTQSNLSKRKGK